MNEEYRMLVRIGWYHNLAKNVIIEEFKISFCKRIQLISGGRRLESNFIELLHVANVTHFMLYGS